MIRLLLVDDEPVMLTVTKRFLEKDPADVECDTCSSAREALEKLATSSYDAIVSDYDMPEMNGIALLKTVRSRYDELPFILLTGRGREEVVIEALNEGADFYLEKSADPRALYAELASKIRHAVNRQRAKVTQCKNEANMARAQKIAHIGDWEWDVKSNALFCSDEHCRMYGLAPGAHPIDTFVNLVHEDDRQYVKDALAATFNDGKPYDIECRIVLKDGTTRIIHGEGEVTYDTHGRPMTLFGIAQDITERKQHEEALRESEEKYRTIVETANEGIWEQDERHITLWANPTMAAMLGYSVEEMIGRPVPDFLFEEDLRKHAEQQAQRQEGIRGKYECRLKHRDGTARWMLVSATPKWGESGKITGSFGMFMDITERKRAEEEIRESKRELQTLTDNSPYLIGRVDRQLRHMFVSRIITRITGKSVEEYLGKTNEELGYPPDLCELWSAHFREVFRTGQPRELEFDFPSPQGLLHFNMGAVPEFGADGTVETVAFVTRDVTNFKQVEAALRESENKYRELFKSMGEGFVLHEMVYDDEGTPVDYLILDINPAYETITGFKREEVIGRGITKVIPYVEPIWFERYDNVARNGVSMQFEEYNAGLDRWYSIRAYPVHRDRQFAVIFTDISERKRVEEALRKSEEKYRRFFEQDLTGDIVSAADGQIIACNPAFLEIFGFNSIEEALNTNIIETYPSPEDRQQFLELIKKEGKVYNFSRIRKRRDGSLITVVENVVGQFDENGELSEILGFLYDDSERKLSEDALKDASKKLNLLTSITRHDILNQVTALRAFLALMQDPPHDEGEAEEMFSNLEKIADTIRRQITFTADYEEMGGRDPEWQQVKWVVRRAEESVRLNGASLALDIGSLEIFSDPMLEKVFYNLLDNAVVHGERVEHIRVSFHEDGDAGVLVFEDDGMGVPASLKDRIFERGFGKITGYGLFLAKEILDITGLSIRETGEEGMGARFEIEVPAGKWRMADH